MISFTITTREPVRPWDGLGQWQAVGFTADGGRISVVHRLTGFGDGDVYDTETGMKDRNGEWHIATSFDIRDVMKDADWTWDECIAAIDAHGHWWGSAQLNADCVLDNSTTTTEQGT